MFSLSRHRLALFSIVLAVLTACGGGSSDPSSVAGDFTAYGVKGTVSGQNVTLDLSGLGNCATNIENMVIGIKANGASISPDPNVARDYSQPVQFTLTAADGTKVVYTVTVKGAECLTQTPTPTPSCVQPAYPTTGYSQVFKGCDANYIATYYAKDECVRDNVTGLIWQGQTPAGTGLRANDQYKTNYDSATELQKWNGSAYVAPTQADLDASTNSIGFKNAVNAIKLCGSSAWRIPTRDELSGIAKKNAAAPMIDTDWFPNTPEFGWYWSDSPWASHPSGGWVVYFYDGFFHLVGFRKSYLSNDYILVRLVR